MNRKKNKLTEYFDENPDTRKIFFVVFYLIFFIFIAILLRNSVSTGTTFTKQNTGLNKSYNLDAIGNKNYHINIIEDVNGEKNIYDGDVNKDKVEYIKSGNPPLYYYKEGNSTYLRNNNTLMYSKVDTPFISERFLTKDALNDLLIHSTYTSLTNYFNGEETDYNYVISTSTIRRLFDKEETDIDDKENNITIKAGENNIEEIDMDLTSYYNSIYGNINDYKLIITYSKFNEIGNINVKVN